MMRPWPPTWQIKASASTIAQAWIVAGQIDGSIRNAIGRMQSAADPEDQSRVVRVE